MEDDKCLEALSETFEEMIGNLERLYKALNTTDITDIEIEELLKITSGNMTRVQIALETQSDKLRYASAHYFLAWYQLGQCSSMMAKAVINCLFACFGMLPVLVMYDGFSLRARLPQLKKKCLEIERIIQNRAELQVSEAIDIFESYLLRTEPALELMNFPENISSFKQICLQLAAEESAGLFLDCARQAYFA